MKGYVQIYTGDGKGKTTAALGLALRAAGAGLKVFIAQFVKGKPTAEMNSIARFSDLITLRQYGLGRFLGNAPDPEDVQAARAGLEEARQALCSGEYKVVVLDEANIAVNCGLFAVESLLELIESRPADVELIITGRYADTRIIAKADLVTEMKKIKHYYDAGVEARKGIEK